MLAGLLQLSAGRFSGCGPLCHSRGVALYKKSLNKRLGAPADEELSTDTSGGNVIRADEITNQSPETFGDRVEGQSPLSLPS